MTTATLNVILFVQGCSGHESIIGSRFENRIEAVTEVGPYPAVIPSIAGQAWITGIYQIGLDPSDPFPNGFTLSDTWLKAIA